ncbi:tetratricopeptide repeat protein [Pseudomonadota bacterium]
MKPLQIAADQIVFAIFLFVLTTTIALAESEFEKTKRLAEAGNAPAQVKLGLMYTSGEGVPKNYAEAVKWCKKAAEQGYANGQYHLGMKYYKGKGIEVDYIQAYSWWNLAAAQGNEKAKESRNILSSSLTQSQIAKAQKISRNFKPVK